MKLRLVPIAGLLVVCATAMAQDHPVNSPAYHAVHNAQSPYYTGPKQQQQLPPPQPTGYWEKTWGALVGDPQKGVMGTAVGASTEQQAIQLAITDCKSKGGGGCTDEFTYKNQCAVMVIGDKGSTRGSAASIEEATASGMRECSQNDTNCRVYYSACTEPIFHKY